MNSIIRIKNYDIYFLDVAEYREKVNAYAKSLNDNPKISRKYLYLGNVAVISEHTCSQLVEKVYGEYYKCYSDGAIYYRTSRESFFSLNQDKKPYCIIKESPDKLKEIAGFFLKLEQRINKEKIETLTSEESDKMIMSLFEKYIDKDYLFEEYKKLIKNAGTLPNKYLYSYILLLHDVIQKKTHGYG